MFELLFKWISRNEKPEFVKNPQEFLSLWAIAHAWEDLDPQATDTSNVPQSIRERLDMLMLATATPDARAACAAVAVVGAGCGLYVLVTRKGSLTYETNQANSGGKRP